jgi:polyisoprenoid-binding protein YceI
MTRYDILTQESRVWIEASSSLHPIHLEAGEIQGHVDLTFTDQGEVDLDQPVAGHVQVDVRDLDTGNSLMDKETERRLEVKRYPYLTGELTSLVASEGANRYHAEGDITVRGVSRRVAGDLIITGGDEAGTVVIEGEQEFDVRDFDLDPPKMLMLKVHPEVQVGVRVTAKKAG